MQIIAQFLRDWQQCLLKFQLNLRTFLLNDLNQNNFRHPSSTPPQWKKSFLLLNLNIVFCKKALNFLSPTCITISLLRNRQSYVDKKNEESKIKIDINEFFSPNKN